MPERPTLEIARFDARRRLKGSLVLSVGIAAFALLFTSFFPSVEQIDVEEYTEAMPEIFRELFNIAAMSSIEGFLAVEIYQFIWVLLLPLYVAYLGAGLIAGEADADRLDVALSLPISRTRLLAGKAAALLPVIVLPNLIVPPVVYAGVLALGESIDPVVLLAVHALSVPFLLAAAAIAVAVSVLLLDADLARRAAIGIVFALYLLDSLSVVADRDWIGAVSPMRYYDPTEIMVGGEYNLLGTVALLAIAAVAFGVATLRFRRVDAP
jgi:ABC-2 type transport system permease protein